jgi:broad specificity phosphatase PhoE
MLEKIFFTLVSAIVITSFEIVGVMAQGNKTIVLVRHAEKAAAMETDKGDPDLSPDGRERAVRLMNAIKRYKPHEIFATDYKRTRQTAEPIAKFRGKKIQTYDPQKQADLIPRIMASKTDHYLVVGHSNTIPAFANLLMKKEVFRQLPEPEYGVFWVIRMKRGLVTKVEIFPY